MATISQRTLRDSSRRWIVNYKVPTTGQQRRKTFTDRRDAQLFAEIAEEARTRILDADRLADHMRSLTASYTAEQRERFRTALFAPHQTKPEAD